MERLELQKRPGYFHIKAISLWQERREVSQILSKCVIIGALPCEDGIFYTCYSELFDEVENNLDMPKYKPHFIITKPDIGPETAEFSHFERISA